MLLLLLLDLEDVVDAVAAQPPHLPQDLSLAVDDARADQVQPVELPRRKRRKGLARHADAPAAQRIRLLRQLIAVELHHQSAAVATQAADGHALRRIRNRGSRRGINSTAATVEQPPHRHAAQRIGIR